MNTNADAAPRVTARSYWRSAAVVYYESAPEISITRPTFSELVNPQRTFLRFSASVIFGGYQLPWQ
jgi:hypothetical protein